MRNTLAKNSITNQGILIWKLLIIHDQEKTLVGTNPHQENGFAADIIEAKSVKLSLDNRATGVQQPNLQHHGHICACPRDPAFIDASAN